MHRYSVCEYHIYLLKKSRFCQPKFRYAQIRYLITCIGSSQDSLNACLGKRWSERALENLGYHLQQADFHRDCQTKT